MNSLQKKELEILKNIVKVIEANNLRYFAIGGTCLGAVRHHGFIPWDDDIDIAMPREDYEKLRTCLYKQLPKHLKKIDYDNATCYHNLFFKIYDSSTTFIEQRVSENLDGYIGVFVDVMPLDGLPNHKKTCKKVLKEYAFWQSMNKLNRPKPNNNTTVKGKLKECVKKPVQLFFKANFFSEKLLNKVEKYDFNESDSILFTWRECGLNRKVFDKSDFATSISIQFEDITIKVPVGYDKYLTQDFGDYMQLPPLEEQRAIHKVLICDLEKPCSYYADLKKRGQL